MKTDRIYRPAPHFRTACYADGVLFRDRYLRKTRTSCHIGQARRILSTSPYAAPHTYGSDMPHRQADEPLMLRTGTFSFFIFFLIRRAVDLQSRPFVLLEEYAKLPAADRSADGTVHRRHGKTKTRHGERGREIRNLLRPRNNAFAGKRFLNK